MACPQAKLKKDFYVETSWGYEVKDEEHSQAYYLKLLTNWHGLKYDGLNWFDCLKSGLIDRGFKQSQIYPCFFTRWKFLMVVCVDNAIIVSKSNEDIEN